MNSDVPSHELVPIVNTFLDVFSYGLPDISAERKFHFGIDILPDIQPTSIPPYHMASAELQELNDRLKQFIEKGFIRLSRSTLGNPILFVRKKDVSLHMCIDCR